MSASMSERPPGRCGLRATGRGLHRESPKRSVRPSSMGAPFGGQRVISPRQVEVNSRYGRGEAPSPEVPLPRPRQKANSGNSKMSLHTNVTPSDQQPFKTRSSSCSFGLRTPFRDHHVPIGPGPLKYKIPEQITRYGKTSTPSYTMGRRIQPTPRKDAANPGPGEYYPENASKRGPAFSFLGRNRSPMSKGTNHDLPAPNQYSLPPCIGGKTPDKPYCGAVLFNGRPKEDVSSYNSLASYRSPGPAQYALPDVSAYKPQAPRATMTGNRKITLGGENQHTPAPSAYSVEAASGCVQPRPPKFTFGMRHSSAAHTLTVKEDK